MDLLVSSMGHAQNAWYQFSGFTNFLMEFFIEKPFIGPQDLLMRDPRTKDWFLVSEPFLPNILGFMYLCVVYFGPKWMEHKPPKDLRGPLVVYNAAMVAFNAYIVYEIFVSSVLRPGFNLFCEPVDRSSHPLSMRIAVACWLFFLSKLFEFFDTVFFILRKKFKQLTFLHVYHHISVFGLSWFCIRYYPGGFWYLTSIVNAFVHVLMYSYYGLAACGPGFRRFLWWKIYLTKLQMYQFWFGLSMNLIAFVLNCGYPRGAIFTSAMHLLSHLILFIEFYHRTYRFPSPQSDWELVKARRDLNANMLHGETFVRKRPDSRLLNGR